MEKSNCKHNWVLYPNMIFICTKCEKEKEAYNNTKKRKELKKLFGSWKD